MASLLRTLKGPRGKSVLFLTPSAVAQVSFLLKSDPSAIGLRLSTERKGCNGLSFTLSYVSTTPPKDDTVSQDGVKLFIDPKALMSVIGSQMDYQSGLLSSGFVFKNPNVSHSCACGESFTVG